MKIVFSLGGSVIVPGDIDSKFIKDFSNFIKRIAKKYKISIVCGGGSTARKYIASVPQLDDISKHEIAIKATHLNAMLIAKLVKGKFSEEAPEKIAKGINKELTVSGGYKPGWTTDVDATIIAKEAKADLLINVTNVNYVYDSDPKINKKAKKIERIKWGEFLKLPAMQPGPGAHFVFDLEAAKICQKAKIKVVVVGKDIKNIENLIEGKKFEGTLIE